MPVLRAVIFANGELPDPERARALLRPGDLLLAADGGSRHLLALDRMPQAVIGDLDSLPAAARARLEAGGADLIAHPRDKDQTDLELALAHALAQGAGEILIVGALGGRLDMTLSGIALLTSPDLLAIDARLDDGRVEAFFVRGQAVVQGRPGEIVSLLPWGAPVTGVTTSGLRWELHNETLLPDASRGLSNELRGARAEVRAASGRLLCIHTRS